jgi:ketosteroid isomerase-like protein
VSNIDGTGELAAWLDKLAIQEAILTSSDAATRGDWEVFATLWAPDAVWEVGSPVDSRVVGAEEIVRTASGNVDAEDFLFQQTHGSVVTLLGGDRASATTTIHALARRTGEHSVTNYGVYYDDLVKLDGAWKFTRRFLQPIYTDTGALDGEIVVTRAQLKLLP